MATIKITRSQSCEEYPEKRSILTSKGSLTDVPGEVPSRKQGSICSGSISKEHEVSFLRLLPTATSFRSSTKLTSDTTAVAIQEDKDTVSSSSCLGDGGGGGEGEVVESLEGTLFCRKGRGVGSSRGSWRERYVVLSMTTKDGGSIRCYDSYKQKGAVSASSESKLVLTRRRRNKGGDLEEVGGQDAQLGIPALVDWVAKDIENGASEFVIEIRNEAIAKNSVSRRRVFCDRRVASLSGSEDSLDGIWSSDDDDCEYLQRKKPLRVYFKCPRGSHEKTLWLQAFRRLDRFSHDFHRKRGVLGSLGASSMQLGSRRNRSERDKRFVQEKQALDSQSSSSLCNPSHQKSPIMKMTANWFAGREEKAWGDDKEFVVLPAHVYPNRWMTNTELHQEMIKPSEVFHDLRVSSAKQKEIGTLKIEVLQCKGLPALDYLSETDAVAYLVCGSYAFATDVIWNKMNPIWLPKSRRGCIFPLFHGYARLFAGVFDDDGKNEKDDFAGRVAIDLARCRPGSSYDVMLPLRLSTHVYSKKPNGVIRLRFTLNWNSDRDAILSYIPKKLRPPTSIRPDDDVVCLCADEKAFRNIALTVHGRDMPGHFSFRKCQATMREANFTRKIVVLTAREFILDTILWRNPAISLFILAADMHCVYINTMSFVPAYAAAFLFLLMFRNYAIFGTGGRLQNGFIPPSFKEMFLSLIRPGNPNVIAPLEVMSATQKVDPVESSTTASIESQANTFACPHKPKGQLLFRLLGFREDNDAAGPLDYQMEFPFSRGLHYPRLTVNESLVTKSADPSKKKKMNSEEDGECEDFEGFDETGIEDPAKNKRISFDMYLRKAYADYDTEEEDFLVTKMLQEKAKEDLHIDQAMDYVDQEKQKLCKDQLHTQSESDIPCDNAPPLPPGKVIPEQNIDITEKKKKKINDELREAKDNVHKLTFHLFNDRTHVIRDPHALYFGQTKRLRRSNVSQDFDRLLNVGYYSSAKPGVARIGLLLEPLNSAAQSGLCLSRSLYNIITWRDPFLSFLVSLLLFAQMIILFIFPWRLFFFVVGFVLIGPQNLLFRIQHERGRLPTCVKKLLERKKKEQISDQVEGLPTDQPVMTCHTPDGTGPDKVSLEELDKRQVHQVCIPYSQLMYQRFYDWPPEAQYAQVHLDAPPRHASTQKPLSSL